MHNTLKKINQIIERDSKDTTYKFALLRGAIEVIQEKTPYQRIEGSNVILPTGLLTLRWLEYYYPIIEADLPQKNGDKFISNTLAFRPLFKQITNYFSTRGGFSVFYSELIRGNLSIQIEDAVFQLCRKIRDTIKKQPMRYLGKSVYGEEYKIFKPIKSSGRAPTPDKLDANYLIQHFGEFSLPKKYYDVLELMGSFITGTHSILINWAEFTADKDKSLSVEQVFETILISPIVGRNVLLSEKIFKNLKKQNGSLECVWSGHHINSDLNIDHLLPFSIWRNNDLWNLFPAKASVNNLKRDKIPSLSLLNKRKDRIISYWDVIRKVEQIGFEKELSMNLITTRDYQKENWENLAFSALKNKCRYLIETRGFEEFNA